MPRLPIRRELFGVLALVVVVALGWPVVAYLAEAHDLRATERMRTIAQAVTDPSSVTATTPRVGGSCMPDAALVRCLHTEAPVDGVAAHYRDALSRAAGRDAKLTCSELRSRSLLTRDCTVRYDKGRHAVLISVTSGVRNGDSGPELDGTNVRVDAV